MKLLAHYIQKELTTQIEKLNQIHGLYIKRSYELEETLPVFLEGERQFFRQIGETKEELKMNELISYFSTAKSGLNPRSLEKIRTGKRDNIILSAFYCINEAGFVLKERLGNVREKLGDASATINNVLLNLLQSGAMTSENLFKVDSIDKCEILWQQLMKDPQINLVDKKLKTTILGKDIYLLLDKAIVDLQR